MQPRVKILQSLDFSQHRGREALPATPIVGEQLGKVPCTGERVAPNGAEVIDDARELRPECVRTDCLGKQGHPDPRARKKHIDRLRLAQMKWGRLLRRGFRRSPVDDMAHLNVRQQRPETAIDRHECV